VFHHCDLLDKKLLCGFSPRKELQTLQNGAAMNGSAPSAQGKTQMRSTVLRAKYDGKNSAEHSAAGQAAGSVTLLATLADASRSVTCPRVVAGKADESSGACLAQQGCWSPHGIAGNGCGKISGTTNCE
jgi:hypothetical protein